MDVTQCQARHHISITPHRSNTEATQKQHRSNTAATPQQHRNNTREASDNDEALCNPSQQHHINITSHRIASHRIPSHRIPSRHTPSHRIPLGLCHSHRITCVVLLCCVLLCWQPYECGYDSCPDRFARRSHLIQHVKARHSHMYTQFMAEQAEQPRRGARSATGVKTRGRARGRGATRGRGSARAAASPYMSAAASPSMSPSSTCTAHSSSLPPPPFSLHPIVLFPPPPPPPPPLLRHSSDGPYREMSQLALHPHAGITSASAPTVSGLQLWSEQVTRAQS